MNQQDEPPTQIVNAPVEVEVRTKLGFRQRLRVLGGWTMERSAWLVQRARGGALRLLEPVYRDWFGVVGVGAIVGFITLSSVLGTRLVARPGA